nr:RagB/SusD family nutrient uptake outer membrane protein [Pedobacter panaciterrae]
MKKIQLLSMFFFIGCFIFSCKKLVEIDGLATSVSSKDVYNTDATAIGVMTNLYAKLSSTYMTETNQFASLSCIAGLSADELTLYKLSDNVGLANYYQNTLTNSNVGFGFWKGGYNGIYIVNSAIEGLESSTTLNSLVKRQLLGEAKFMRAFYYFYLVNLYGNVPLVLGTDYSVNAIISNSSKDQIYNQIITDLMDAQDFLSENYLEGNCISESEERIRPTKWAATALLSRTYLFKKDWLNAELQATVILEKGNKFGMESLEGAFLKNNKEAIWQLQPVIRDNNTMEGNTFLLPENGPSSSYPVFLSDDFIKDFESGDQRKVKWINHLIANGITYYYPYKYKSGSAIGTSVNEYSTVIRLAEIYLIRAEARAQQGNLDGAITDLDIIRSRSNLSLIRVTNPGIDRDNLISTIFKERKFELFTEWGHRWLDLKRSNKIDKVMEIVTPKKSNGAGWKNNQQLYPIYYQELERNPKLIQNPEY